MQCKQISLSVNMEHKNLVNDIWDDTLIRRERKSTAVVHFISG